MLILRTKIKFAQQVIAIPVLSFRDGNHRPLIIRHLNVLCQLDIYRMLFCKYRELAKLKGRDVSGSEAKDVMLQLGCYGTCEYGVSCQI